MKKTRKIGPIVLAIVLILGLTGIELISAGDNNPRVNYALFLSSFWIKDSRTYSILVKDIGFTDENIYFCHELGTDPSGGNPGNIIDYPLTKEKVIFVLNELAQKIDENDTFSMWVDVIGSRGPEPEKHRIATRTEAIADYELASYLLPIKAKRMVFVFGQHYSGGFIPEISGPGRIIMTSASGTETADWGTDLFAAGFQDKVGDLNKNGYVSCFEAFNYACQEAIKQFGQCNSMYDDNGDKIGHFYPAPQGGDGLLGAATYFEDLYPALPGDANRDGKVDVLDLIFINTTFNTIALEEKGYKVQADLNLDGVIDIFDATIAGINFGKVI